MAQIVRIALLTHKLSSASISPVPVDKTWHPQITEETVKRDNLTLRSKLPFRL
jgi:hypothetical protein